MVADWFFSDRSHSSLILLVCIAVWFLWSIRGNFKLILKGLLKRP